jgi:hypothetical protein
MSPSAALCGDAAALRSSVDQLATVTVAPGLADELRSDLSDAKAHLSALADDAHGQWETQTAAVASALAALETALRTLAASPGGAAATEVRTAVTQLGAAVTNLLSVVRPVCPPIDPSPSA